MENVLSEGREAARVLRSTTKADTRHRIRPGPPASCSPVGRRQASLLPLGDRLQLREPPLEVGADHLVHPAHEEGERLREEVVVAAHRPGDRRAGTRRRELEQVVGGRRERLDELELDVHAACRLAVGDRHAPLADIAVAHP